MTRDHAHWIDLLTVEVGGQTVSSQAPYALYLPGPIKQIVVTKRPDSTSGAFSAAFASPTEVRGMKIDIVHPNLDSRGAPVGPQHSGLTVGDMWIASFKSTGATETIVFTKEKPVRTPASQEFGRRQSVATPAPEGRKR